VIALGERLFNDPTLSGPGTRSCATCHNASMAFTDGRSRAAVLSTHAQLTARNTPTLINAAYQPQLFFDERVSSLEDQAGAVLANPAEMASSADIAAQRLATRADMREAFARVFPNSPGGSLTPRTVRFALAAYVRSLAAFNSRFDRAARGDTTALTAQERHGFNLFMGKARCGTCHFAPLFNGTSPPAFTSSEVEIIGVPTHPVTHHATLDPDIGRAGFDRIDRHKYAFKVPTLRNIALTAPYMHNGVYQTLDQVLDFYNRGGGAGIGISLPTQTLSARPLHLTKTEEADVIAFLKALTDTTRHTL
jgi:cytochrome c peroxidase